MTSETQAWREAMDALTDRGMTPSNAAQKLMREQPKLYIAMMESVGMSHSEIVKRLGGRASAR